MAIWPFGKKKKQRAEEQPSQDAGEAHTEPSADVNPEAERESIEPILGADSPAPSDTPGDAAAASNLEVTVKRHDAINGEMGPFDGGSVDIETFDFSDFSNGILDLKSIKVPLPKKSQVQVEMGAKGPKMLHIITEFGRITPVAFAAPRSSGQWESSVGELVENIHKDGMDTDLEEGPWGTEIVAQNSNGMIRIIGVEGPRWLLRMTLAAPTGREENLTELAREVASRTFVYRGDDPMLAGNSLPVTMPPQLVKQVQDEMERRKKEQNQPKASNANNAASPSPADKAAQEAAARQLFQMLGGNAAAAKKNSENHPENTPDSQTDSTESNQNNTGNNEDSK